MRLLAGAIVLMACTFVHADSEGVITDMKGTDVRVSLGAADGVTRGAALAVVKDGKALAHVRIVSVFTEWSVGRLVEANARDLVTLGDAVRLTPAEPKPVSPPLITRRAETKPPRATPIKPATEPAATASAAASVVAPTVVAAVRDHAITLSGGVVDGWRTGTLVLLLRDTVEVARARVDRVTARTAEATIIQYAPGQQAQIGDEARLARGSSLLPRAGDEPTGERRAVPRASVPTREPAQHSVAPTDRAYPLLAQLAASGLIKSVPARVFQQNTVLRHRPGEEVVFTRAKVAELINEALTTGARDDSFSGSNAHALSQLVRDFASDVRGLGLDVASIEQQLQERTRSVPIGISGMAQMRATKATNNGPDPRSEPLAVRNGIAGEARLNLFGNVGPRVGFFGQLEGSTLATNRTGSAGARGIVRNGSGNYRMGPWEIEGGRKEFWHGPGQFGTLLLSDTAGNFDYVQTRMRRGDFAFEGFSTVIGRDPLRSLHVHRVEFTASPTFRLGASEMVMRFDGKVSPAHFLGANLPLPLLVLGGGFGNNKLNELFNFYAEATTPKGARLYGEFLIDDLVVKVGETQNHRLGYLMGAQLFNPRAPHTFNTRLEFANLQARTYLSFFPPGSETESFFRNGQPLGYFLTTLDDRGQGINVLRFDANFMPLRKLTLGGGWELLDQGTDRAGVSRQSNLRFRAIYDLANSFSLTLRGVKATTTNPFFTGGASLDRNRVEFELMKAF